MPIDSSSVLPGGHRVRRCLSCGRSAALADDRACYLTPDCRGRLELVDLPAQSRTEKRAGRLSCGRSGCGNAQAVTTALGEGACLRCLAELGAQADGDATGPQA